MIPKFCKYVSDDEDSDDGALQESAVQEDCEASDADVEQNAVNLQHMYETTVNQVVLDSLETHVVST